jgi:hypothetical protein
MHADNKKIGILVDSEGDDWWVVVCVMGGLNCCATFGRSYQPQKLAFIYE